MSGIFLDEKGMVLIERIVADTLRKGTMSIECRTPKRVLAMAIDESVRQLAIKKDRIDHLKKELAAEEQNIKKLEEIANETLVVLSKVITIHELERLLERKEE